MAGSDFSPQVVILAGGLGTRLRPLTEQVPKALISIHGKPFIHFQLEYLASNGIREVVLSTGYLGHQIQEFVQDGSSWGLQVKYAYEGDELRGTGGALRFIFEQQLLQERFLLTYGDSYLPVDFQKVWKSFSSSSSLALMTLFKNKDQWDSSNACFDGSKVTLYEKNLKTKPPEMLFIDYGLMGIDRSIIPKYLPLGKKCDLSAFFTPLSKEGKLAGFEVKERFYEIGSLQGIASLERYLIKDLF